MVQGTSTELLERLPEVLGPPIQVHELRADGVLDPAQGLEVAMDPEGPAVRVRSGAAAFVGPVDPAGTRMVVVAPTARPEVLGFLHALFATLHDKAQVERDLESMVPSSLNLLEEVAMVGETMPKLSAGRSEEEIAELGLSAFVVAAHVERALYVRVDRARGVAEVLVHVLREDRGGPTPVPVVVPYGGDGTVLEDDGLVWRAARCTGGALLETRVEHAGGWAAGSPEALAADQVLAAPVRYGDGESARTLGVVMVMDKRPSRYSSVTTMGSEECKLAEAMAAMLGSVLGARRVAELGKELELANAIQRQILPERSVEVPGFDVAGACLPSGAVGGDYYDYLAMADGRTLAVVADVSGHNLASGMLMVAARASLRVLAAEERSPQAIFDRLAAALFSDLTRTERFITAMGVALAPGSHSVEMVSAGHCDALVCRASGAVEHVAGPGPIFGFVSGARHETRRIELQPGDTVLLYTDGITECCNPAGEMFGVDRLSAVVARSAAGSADAVLAAILSAVQGFADPAAGRDDVTAVVIRAVGVPQP